MIALWVALAYTTLHEGGHALAGLVFGGRIREFDLNFFNLGAHVSIDGEFNRSQDAIINESGAGLPLLVWMVLILALPKKGSPLVQWTKFISTAGILCSLLAWIVIPLLYLQDRAPFGDDVTKFLFNTGLPPLGVAFGSLALFAGGWLLFAARIEGLRNGLGVLFKSNAKTVAIWRLALMGGLISLVLVGSGILINFTHLPAGYYLASAFELSRRDVQAESIARFEQAVAGNSQIYLSISGIHTRYIDVSLVPLQGDPLPLLHGEDFFSETSNSRFQFNLPAGTYDIILTSRRSPGILKVYLRLP
jgi:hypothetical protein